MKRAFDQAEALRQRAAALEDEARDLEVSVVKRVTAEGIAARVINAHCPNWGGCCMGRKDAHRCDAAYWLRCIVADAFDAGLHAAVAVPMLVHTATQSEHDAE